MVWAWCKCGRAKSLSAWRQQRLQEIRSEGGNPRDIATMEDTGGWCYSWWIWIYGGEEKDEEECGGAEEHYGDPGPDVWYISLGHSTCWGSWERHLRVHKSTRAMTGFGPGVIHPRPKQLPNNLTMAASHSSSERNLWHRAHPGFWGSASCQNSTMWPMWWL